MDSLIRGHHLFFWHVSRERTHVRLKKKVSDVASANATTARSLENCTLDFFFSPRAISTFSLRRDVAIFPFYEGHYSLFDVDTVAQRHAAVLQISDVTQPAVRHVIGGSAQPAK